MTEKRYSKPSGDKKEETIAELIHVQRNLDLSSLKVICGIILCMGMLSMIFQICLLLLIPKQLERLAAIENILLEAIQDPGEEMEANETRYFYCEGA